MDRCLSVRLLGGFSLQEGDDPSLAPGSSRIQSLVAWLASSPAPSTTRQVLAETLWPGAGDRQARNNLRQLLHQLRHAWPGHARWIVADPQAVTWRGTDVRVDVLEFERTFASAQATWQRGERDQAALALGLAAGVYAGPLLPACSDEWIARRREQLQKKAVQALETLSCILEEQHDLQAAIERATALVAVDPVRERSYLRLMRLHSANRDRAAAIRVYEQCVGVLRRELDAAPGSELRDLFARLTRPAAAASAAAGRRDEVSATPLIGRTQEWRRVRDAWERAERGPAHLILVSGEAGIGKTRLGEEALAWAESQGIATARARAYEAEGGLALAPVTAWLRSPAIRSTLSELDTVWLSDIARLVTELLIERPDLPPPLPLADYGQRQRFFEALARAITGAAPFLVLLLDDLQWCDPDTIEWLHYLLRADTAARMLVIGTARMEEVNVDHPLTRFQAALQTTGQITEIPLRELDAAETGRLISVVAGRDFNPDEVLRLFRDTAGNPLFVVETVRAMDTFVTPATDPPGPSTLPPRVSAVITGRLRQLSADGRELAGVAATIGRAFTSDLLLRASGLDEERVSHALEELWQRRIIREADSLHSANAYDFTHDKLREVAYFTLSPVQRRRWHRRVAVALGGMFASNLDAVAAQIAAHHDRSGQTTEALPLYDRAAQVAMRLFAYDEAQTMLRRMLVLLDQEPESPARAETELRIQLMLAAAVRAPPDGPPLASSRCTSASSR
jgi:DNA-binding SARP family transcriptional activator